jgi:tRNA pseudouridine55 synthase
MWWQNWKKSCKMDKHGILNLYKPAGITSHDAVARVRKLLHQRRVGHAGTLDPLASGVLPVCVGQATRVAEYLSESGKAYRATLVFGVETETYDAEGAITQQKSVDTLELDQLLPLLDRFIGPQQQMPPLYSAIKVQGQAAYKRVRAGEEITLEARPIEIFRLQVVDWQKPVLILDVSCSKGTYIRSLAHDLGQAAGYGAHLGGLIRTRSGPFRLDESLTLEELAAACAQNAIDDYLQPADTALADYPALRLDNETAQRVCHGNSFACPCLVPHPSLARVYDPAGTFLAIAAWDSTTNLWQPKKVFLEN